MEANWLHVWLLSLGAVTHASRRSEIHIDVAPFVVSISLDNIYVCSGSALSPTIILTLAHCINPASLPSYLVRSGSPQWKGLGSEHTIVKFSKHPDYKVGEYSSDLALLLIKPATGLRTQDIAHLSTTEPQEKEDLVLLGWALRQQQFNGSVSDNLSILNAKTAIYERCVSLYGLIEDSLFCFGSRKHSACPGDEGAGIQKVADKSLLGLVVAVQPCGNLTDAALGILLTDKRISSWMHKTIEEFKKL